MNPGGEPERDDTGLPPVDIEIPDDARELDRDVQAYFRELRAERRRQRRGRLNRGLARDGVVLPLLACCLILALITGTLLTVFTATSDQNLVTPPGSSTNTSPAGARDSSSPGSHPSPGARSSASASPRPSGRSSSPGAASSPQGSSSAGPQLRKRTVQLPAGGLIIDNEQIPLRNMIDAMLVLIPTRCHCATAVSNLAQISADSGTVLVGTQRTITEARNLQSRLNPRIATNVLVAFDGQGVLQKVVPVQGLTAVVISGTTTPGGSESVEYASQLTARALSVNNGSLSAALTKAIHG